jgi:hypothetical protein
LLAGGITVLLTGCWPEDTSGKIQLQ